jgi:hypothetical protein
VRVKRRQHSQRGSFSHLPLRIWVREKLPWKFRKHTCGRNRHEGVVAFDASEPDTANHHEESGTARIFKGRISGCVAVIVSSITRLPVSTEVVHADMHFPGSVTPNVVVRQCGAEY